jgi:3-oxoacyl-[acyl-carrier protein] reductase
MNPPPVAVITGAAGGLGAAMVREFQRKGWTVAAVTHRRELPLGAAQAASVALDLTDARQVRNGFEKLLQKLGRFDALVNNAGITADESLARLGEEAWDRVLDVNLRGAFLCSRAVIPSMISRKEGCIINIASHSGKLGAAGQANYAASKAGLFGLTQSLAAELGPPENGGIRVNAVLPGFMETPMTAPIHERQRRALVQANALKRMNSVEEVARFVVFLTGMRDVSGQIFQLDSRITPWT